MQGLLTAALAPTAPPRSPSSSARPPAPAPLSSANLALHTSTNPPAPRRTVQQFLASVTRVHAANAYDLGPPPAGELDHVKTPPRAVEARRKRKLQDLEDRGERWITRHKTTPRAPANGTEQALVLIRPDADLLLRGSTTSETADLKQTNERKKSLVASMMRRKSTPPANAASATQRKPLLPISGPSPASDESSILMPRARTETKPATTRRKAVAEQGGGKENRSGREGKASVRKGKNANRRDMDKDAAEQEELEEHEARLEARRDRRRQNVLIRKDRSLAATAVGATAAAKLKKSKSKQRPAMTASGSNHSSDDDDEENALETTGYRKRKKGKGTKDVRSRKKVAGLDRPQHVGQGRLTLKPTALGIFSKGKASARAKTGAHHQHRKSFLLHYRVQQQPGADSTVSNLQSLPLTRKLSCPAPLETVTRSPARQQRLALLRRRRQRQVPMTGRQDGLRAGMWATTPRGQQPPSAALDRTAATRPAAVAKKRLSTKKQTPDFELDIPPWPRTSSLARRSRAVDDDKGAGAGSADDADSTHPSILSAASLARRRAKRTAIGKRMSTDAEQEVAPFDGGASVHAPARPAAEPVVTDADDADLWQGPDGNVDSANTSGSAFERLLAEVTNAADADDAFEASPPSFEALSARSAIVGGSGLQDQLRGVLPPEPASEVGRAAADAYLVAAAAGTIEEEDPTTAPYVDNTSISFPNETVSEEAEPVAFADFDGAQSASTAAAVTFHPLTPDHGATSPERFPTPSDLSPPFVVADCDNSRLDDGGAPTGLDDEAAFRTAMRRQWPKTLL
ncbi:hypothetical protein JCM8115_002038 [Rhodotorula mucilaginosa]